MDTPPTEITEAMWLAIIAGVLSIATLVLNHLLSAHSRRIETIERGMSCMQDILADVIEWSFALESHIVAQKPPPPPARPDALVRFFSTSLIASKNERSHDGSLAERLAGFCRLRSTRPEEADGHRP